MSPDTGKLIVMETRRRDLYLLHALAAQVMRLRARELNRAIPNEPPTYG